MPESVRFSTLIKAPDLITLLSLAFGVSSIFFASNQNFMIAALFLAAAFIFDGIDGLMANLIKRKGRFGSELDSLADAISFGAAPGLFGYFLGLKDFSSSLLLIIFILASILRLARFNVIKRTYNYYLGLATTVNGAGIPLLYFIISSLNLPWDISKTIYLSYYLLSSILMVSSIKIYTIKLFRL